jgi:citronellol/citronellal dehydrogenase
VDGGTPNNRTSYWKLASASHNTPFEGFHRSVLPELLRSRD